MKKRLHVINELGPIVKRWRFQKLWQGDTHAVRLAAVFLLSLYALALGHEFIVDDHDGAHCGLCLLMASPSLVAAAVLLTVTLAAVATSFFRFQYIPPCGSPCRIEYRRGPPRTILH